MVVANLLDDVNIDEELGGCHVSWDSVSKTDRKTQTLRNQSISFNKHQMLHKIMTGMSGKHKRYDYCNFGNCS